MSEARTHYHARWQTIPARCGVDVDEHDAFLVPVTESSRKSVDEMIVCVALCGRDWWQVQASMVMDEDRVGEKHAPSLVWWGWVGES